MQNADPLRTDHRHPAHGGIAVLVVRTASALDDAGAAIGVAHAHDHDAVGHVVVQWMEIALVDRPDANGALDERLRDSLTAGHDVEDQIGAYAELARRLDFRALEVIQHGTKVCSGPLVERRSHHQSAPLSYPSSISRSSACALKQRRSSSVISLRHLPLPS